MPWLTSRSSSTWPSAAGCVKLGQPQPESNLASDSNSVCPQPAQIYVPGVCSCSYSPENGRSVAFSRSTAYCIGVNSLRHSASLFSTLPVIVLVSDMKPPCKWSVLSREADAGSREEHPVNSLKSPSVGHLGAAHQRRFLDVVLGDNLLQVLDLPNVVISTIWLCGVQRQVVLMIGLRRIKRFQRADLGHDRLLVDLGGVELADLGLRDLLLFVAGGKDGRAILRARVRALTVQLGRIVRHRKKDLQDLAIADFLRVVFDLDGLGVAGRAGPDHGVVGRRLSAAGV